MMKQAHAGAMEELKTTIPAFLERVGGTKQKKDGLRIDWTEEAVQDSAAVKINLEAEIRAALAQEAQYRIVQRLYSGAREVAPVKTLWAGSLQSYQNVVDAIVKAASGLGEGAIIVVSPMLLTIIQACAYAPFVRGETATTMSMMTSPVGTLAGFEVYIDPYANDTVPALIAAPGWFEFEAGAVVYEDPSAATASMRRGTTWYDDVKFTIDAAKVTQVAATDV